MNLVVIHPENESQQKALELILDGLKIPYEIEPQVDETVYLTSTKANKERLDAALLEEKNSGGIEIKLDDLWK